MGTSNQPAVETPTLSDGWSENHQNADHLPHSPCFPPSPRLLCPPEQTQPDQGPTAGSKPEPANHPVLHGQPGHCLRGLGSCSGRGHPILCQPGVQPVQEQGRHQEQQQQGDQQQDLRDQLQHRQRYPWIPWRFCCGLCGSECWTYLQLRLNRVEANSNLCGEKLVIDWALSALLLFKSHLLRNFSDNKL